MRTRLSMGLSFIGHPWLEYPDGVALHHHHHLAIEYPKTSPTVPARRLFLDNSVQMGKSRRRMAFRARSVLSWHFLATGEARMVSFKICKKCRRDSRTWWTVWFWVKIGCSRQWANWRPTIDHDSSSETCKRENEATLRLMKIELTPRRRLEFGIANTDPWRLMKRYYRHFKGYWRLHIHLSIQNAMWKAHGDKWKLISSRRLCDCMEPTWGICVLDFSTNKNVGNTNGE